MNKKYLIYASALVIIITGVLWFTFHERSLPLDYKDIEYDIGGQRIVLHNGRAETPGAPQSSARVITTYFGNEVKKDIDGDGDEDVVFLVTQNAGGTGTFYYVVAALKTDGGYVGSKGMLIGDRIAPQTTVSGPGKQVIVNYADRKPGESMATQPSVGKSLYLLFDSKINQFGEVVQDFEGESNVPRQTSVLNSSHVVVAAGDIARARTGKQMDTAALVESLHPEKVLTLGDNAYESGTPEEFRDVYGPSWGIFRSITAPSPGNHDYKTANADGYFRYFGALAGPVGQGYYSFDIGSWHLVSLNSEVLDQRQLDWLRSDLQKTSQACILAYWHKPLFSSGTEHGNDPAMKPLWDLLYAKHADIILNGHEHNYERFAKQNPQGQIDRSGIREFVVGTGGANEEQYTFSTIKKNSEVHVAGQFGVLKLSLNNNSYDAEFVPARGSMFTDKVSAVVCNTK